MWPPLHHVSSLHIIHYCRNTVDFSSWKIKGRFPKFSLRVRQQKFIEELLKELKIIKTITKILDLMANFFQPIPKPESPPKLLQKT